MKLTRIGDFFKNTSKITRIEHFVGTISARLEIVKSALLKLGQPYRPLSYNCEHFANDILKKKPTSNQVATAFGLVVIAAIIAVALTNKN